MMRFTDYHKARDHAENICIATKLDIAIRSKREFGKDGYNVTFACANDSDYAKAEIVTLQECLL